MSLLADYRRRAPELLKCLENARAAGRFAHAFLVHSSSERERREFSLVLAQIAGCPHAVNGRPDGSCGYCSRLESGTYPELHTLSPMGKMYQIKVGERVNPEPNTLRRLLDELSLTGGAVNRHKIALIADADRMNDEAQNALLKTLEEPPPETTIILATANPATLLPTTRSRCQLIPLPASRCVYDFSGADELFRQLGQLTFPAEPSLAAAEIATRKILDILNQLGDAAAAAVAPEFDARSAAAAQLDDPALLKRIESRRQDAVSGARMRERATFLSAIVCFCSQLYLLANGAAPENLPNPEIFSGLSLPPQISVERGTTALREAEELEYTLKFNVNEELAIRAFAVNLMLS